MPNDERLDIVDRLLDACVGQPAKIAWPHRLLRDAVDEINRLRAKPHCDEGKALEALQRIVDWVDDAFNGNPVIMEMLEQDEKAIRAALTSPPMASGWVEREDRQEPYTAIAELGDTSSLPDKERNSLEQKLRKGLEDRDAEIARLTASLYWAKQSPCPTASEATGKVDDETIKAMAYAYEAERASYVGGSVYYPNNGAAHIGAMTKAIALLPPQPPAQSWEWIEDAIKAVKDCKFYIEQDMHSTAYNKANECLIALDAVKAEAEKRGKV